MRPEDLSRLSTPGAPQLHPDGVRVAFTVTTPDLEGDRYVTRIHLFDGDTTRVLTHGPSDSSPRWSPDGRWLAFLRKGEADTAKPQVVVMPADGGEALPVTDVKLGASALAWAPDSDRLVVVGATYVSELADLDDDERKRRPRRITRTPFRFDNRGWIHERRDHLYLVSRDGTPGEEECLTPGDEFDETLPAWSPDGAHIAFVSRRHGDRDVEPGDTVFELDLGRREVRELSGVGDWSGLAYAPDGTLHAVGLADVHDWPAPLSLFRLTDDGVEPVAPDLDRQVVSGDDLAFLDDGSIVLRHEDRGRVRAVRIHDGEVTELVGGDRQVTGLAIRPDGSAWAFTATSLDDPGELSWLEVGGEERVVSAVNADFREAVRVTPTRHLTFERDGAELDAWLLVPEGEGPFPLLLNIHGGPTAQYGFGLFDEFQVYAAAGYAVIGTNPRGSSGRGRDWMRAVVGAWSDPDSVDMLDLRAAVDAAVAADDRVDAGRVGIMGGSYGGYATARILARDQRFASAVVERGLLQWESFCGTSDIGQYFDRMFLGSSLKDGADVHRAASPTALAANVTTPTLVLHSEEDWRCPIEQAEQLFAALKRHGVETEMLRFPGEGHELSRSGAPKHRVERFEAILDWHARYLAP